MIKRILIKIKLVSDNEAQPDNMHFTDPATYYNLRVNSIETNKIDRRLFTE